jgi:DNA-binding transcriptional ArsR family regulator
MTAADPHTAAAEVFAVLANATRLRLLAALLDGGLAAGSASAAAGVKWQDGSQHLARLRHAGLVERTREGISQRYTLTPAGERAAKLAAKLAAALTDAA